MIEIKLIESGKMNEFLKDYKKEKLPISIDEYSSIIVFNYNNKNMGNFKITYKDKADKKSSTVVVIINLNCFDRFSSGEFIHKTYINKICEINDINLEYLYNMNFEEVCKLPEDSLERLLYWAVCQDKEKLDYLYKDNEMMAPLLKALYKEFGY